MAALLWYRNLLDFKTLEVVAKVIFNRIKGEKIFAVYTSFKVGGEVEHPFELIRMIEGREKFMSESGGRGQMGRGGERVGERWRQCLKCGRKGVMGRGRRRERVEVMVGFGAQTII